MKSRTSTERGQYAAFLRGINNAGGAKTIAMQALRRCFESLGYTRVQTLLASGNVLFETRTASESSIIETIERGLHRDFGVAIITIVRPVDELRRLVASKPFRAMEKEPGTAFYVTFLGGRSVTPRKAMDAGGVFELLKTTRREIFSVVRHGSGRNTSRMMQLFERTYGSDITTRNWNTIEKVVSMADTVAVT